MNRNHERHEAANNTPAAAAIRQGVRDLLELSGDELDSNDNDRNSRHGSNRSGFGSQVSVTISNHGSDAGAASDLESSVPSDAAALERRQAHAQRRRRKHQGRGSMHGSDRDSRRSTLSARSSIHHSRAPPPHVVREDPAIQRGRLIESIRSNMLRLPENDALKYGEHVIERVNQTIEKLEDKSLAHLEFQEMLVQERVHKHEAVKTYLMLYSNTLYGAEMLHYRFNPFGWKLKGLSNEVNNNLNRLTQHFEDLYNQIGFIRVPPAVMIAGITGFIALSTHNKNSEKEKKIEQQKQQEQQRQAQQQQQQLQQAMPFFHGGMPARQTQVPPSPPAPPLAPPLAPAEAPQQQPTETPLRMAPPPQFDAASIASFPTMAPSDLAAPVAAPGLSDREGHSAALSDTGSLDDHVVPPPPNNHGDNNDDNDDGLLVLDGI